VTNAPGNQAASQSGFWKQGMANLPGKITVIGAAANTAPVSSTGVIPVPSTTNVQSTTGMV
jgi:hypothetical protein